MCFTGASRHEAAHCFSEALQARGAGAAHALDRRGGDPDVKQIGHERDEALLRKQLLVRQIDRESGDPRAILHRRVYALRKRAPRSRAAARALADMRPMLGDDERARLGQVVHLTRRVIERHAARQRAAASRTDRRKMIDDLIRRGGLAESLALVALLPARLFVRALTQARHPRRLLQPVARRRLAAVGTVQAEPPLEFPNPSHKRGDLCRLRLDQRDQFCTRPNIWRFSDHPILESQSDPQVQENPLKITKPGNNLGSYD